MSMAAALETDWLKKWAMYSPENVALKDADNGAETTYAQFFQYTNRLARYFHEHYGVREGDRVAVLATNEPEYIYLFFALQRLSAVMVPMNFRLTSREVAHILSDCSPKVLIHQRQFDGIVQQLDSSVLPARVLHFDGPESLTTLVTRADLPAEPIPMTAGADTACMILYTSGTTGSPKGAVITHGMMFWNSVNTGLRLNLTQNDVYAAFLPFFHTGGWNVLTTPFLHRGAKVILLRKFDGDRILRMADREKMTILFGVPTMMDMMAQSPAFTDCSLQTVRYAIVGGEPMPVELIKTWQKKGVPIRQGYGLTEFGPNVFSLNEQDAIRKIGSIGFPNFYIDVKIVGEDGRELGPDEIGELALKGPTATPGYFNNPQATASTIRDGWLYTGDLVRKDSEGYFYVVGRKKDMYISGGENVYPAEVEQFLRTHPKIHEAAVIGVPDAKWGEVGKAFLSLHRGETLSEQEVLSFCAGSLAKYKTPKYIRFLKELPKGDSGKILKRALAELPDA